MILVIDVGNTNIVLGLYKGRTLLHHWRVSTNRSATVDEYGMQLYSLFQHSGIKFSEVEGVIVSSVVPPLVSVMENLCLHYLKRTPFTVGPGIKTGLNVRVDNPKEVGADRIVNAVAALELYGAPCIIVDFGTATTYDYIDPAQQLVGCAIAPGIGISTEALYQKAAKLPRIELVKPKSVVGRNTVTAMQAGIIYGYVGQVDGIVERVKQEFNVNPTVIATGGLAELISSESRTIQIVNPLLTLQGLQMIYEKNA
ncbi:type III pantothenate kinase [Paenibacillus aceris]|uniref:Type III pantothenate kinase n=1 Tax=Paenibacillus aceris TaxID=869555 RepID=A0ABS4I9S3_9BACL|nr:type III pantothenate kinase [Paenibacillus aceris]MBP1967241.1 type III pantothenate kinase [Paenibacillus aceris]NHW36279.1 type III pantothenate kinase [Paenibacillus aceris]